MEVQRSFVGDRKSPRNLDDKSSTHQAFVKHLVDGNVSPTTLICGYNNRHIKAGRLGTREIRIPVGGTSIRARTGSARLRMKRSWVKRSECFFHSYPDSEFVCVHLQHCYVYL